MYEIYNNKIGISVGWMIENGIVSSSNWKLLVFRNQATVLRRGCRGTPALAELYSLPKRYYNQVIGLAGKPDEVRRVNNLENEYEPVPEVIKFFEDWAFDGGRKLTPEKRTEYICNAQLLVAANKLAIRLTNKRKVVKYPRTIQGKKVPTVWEMIADDLAELNTKDYPHSLPLNLRRFQEKVKQYMKEGPICLIHKNFQNKAASKVKDDVQEAFLRQALSLPNGFDAEQIAAMYNSIAEQSGWDTITARVVRSYAKSMNLEIYSGRAGNDFYNKKTMQVTRRAPSYPGYYWTLDGWDVELNYQKTGYVTDKKDPQKKRKVTTYHNRMTIVVVLDACQKYPIGYAIGERESPELIRQALRNAVNHTRELFGVRHKPHQIQSDNYGGGELRKVYEGICRHYTPAKVGNAKAKIIEPYFKYLQKSYCQYSLINWTGFGAKAKNQPNFDFKNKTEVKKQIPDQEGVTHQITAIMEMDRAKKREKYLELWQQSPESKRLTMETSNYLYFFGEETELNTISGRGLEPKVLGVRMRFDTFDFKFRREAERFKVKFDPEDLSEVLAVNEAGSKQYTLYPPHEQPMALVEREEGDAAELHKIFDFNDNIVQHVLTVQQADRTKIAEHVSENPIIGNSLLAKACLTDSRGQHKNYLQDSNGKTETKERVKKALKERAVEVVEESKEPVFDVRAAMAKGIDFESYKNQK